MYLVNIVIFLHFELCILLCFGLMLNDFLPGYYLFFVVVLKIYFSFPFTFTHITNNFISHRQFMDKNFFKTKEHWDPAHSFTLTSFRELIDLSEPWMQLCDWANGTLCAALLSHQHFCSYTDNDHANISPRVRQLKGSLWSISSWGLCWLNNEKVISLQWLHPQASVRNTFCCGAKTVFDLYINYLSNT